MIYITGDTHGDFHRFSTSRFPEQKEMTRDDFIIICGDFGGIWNGGTNEDYWLKWLSEKPFTFLFVDGNHENFDRLYNDEFPVVDFHGGKAHKIRDNIYHLMRGQIFTLCGKTFFTFGGASSHDIEDGILDEEDYPSYLELRQDYNRRRRLGEFIRINHYSWWKEELPSDEEMEEGRRNLAAHDNQVDFVISHSPPQQVCSTLGYHNPDRLTMYFYDLLENGLKFKKWYSGHLHIEEIVMSKFCIHYEGIERVV